MTDYTFDEYTMTDDELLMLLDVDDLKPELPDEDEPKVTKNDFNYTVKDKIYNCNPEDVMSVLFELQKEFDVDEEDFSRLLDDGNKAMISNKLIKINLVQDPDIDKNEIELI